MIVNVVGFKMTKQWTLFFSSKNKDISSYMELQLNNIVVLDLSPQTVTFLYQNPKTNYPVSIYSVTQLSHICVIQQASFMTAATFVYVHKCLE